MVNKELISEILIYIKENITNDHYPSYSELQSKFNLRKFHLKLSDLYPLLGVKYLNFKSKRPNNSINEIKNELIKYLKKEIKKGHYPRRRFIEKTFKLRFPNFGISTLYSQAGLTYKPKLNQNLKLEKAKLLQDITKSILPKLDLILIKERKIHERGVDLLTKNKGNNLIGIEVKANHALEPIKRQTLNQVNRFIKIEKLSKVIIITTTLKKDEAFSNKIANIEILDYNSLKKFCTKDQIVGLDYIRTKSIDYNFDSQLKKRKIILDYVKEKIKLGEDISYKSILKDLYLGIYSYFNNIFEIYEAANLLPPLKKTKNGDKYREIILAQMIDYIKRESEKNHYPTGKEIGQKFGCPHIWTYISMTDLYKKVKEN